MKTKTKEMLRVLFAQMQDIHPRASTEFVLELTAQQARALTGENFDTTHVAEAVAPEEAA